MNRRETLAFVAPLYKLNYVIFQGGLIVLLPYYLLCKHKSSRVVAIDPLMNFVENVGFVFHSNILEEVEKRNLFY